MMVTGRTWCAGEPTTLGTLDFVPKYVELVGGGKSDATIAPFYDDDSIAIRYPRIMTSTLTTEFQQNQGCCALSLQYSYYYGRKSEDGKTLYWYGDQKPLEIQDYPMYASVQFNASGARYVLPLIG